MAGKPGPPKILKRRHILEIKKDTREWIEDTLETYTDKRSFGSNSRVIGAAIAAAGVYAMVRLIDEFGRGVLEGIKNITRDVFTGVSVPVINVFLAVFGAELQVGEPFEDLPEGVQEKLEKKGVAPATQQTLSSLANFDPFAMGAALTAGGMVLAGLNPGEILKGIGSIIDALIPL